MAGHEWQGYRLNYDGIGLVNPRTYNVSYRDINYTRGISTPLRKLTNQSSRADTQSKINAAS